jgi:hypothetical protein
MLTPIATHFVSPTIHTIHKVITVTPVQMSHLMVQHQSILDSIGSFFNIAVVGAFLGSFSAFIFGIIAYDYTKRRERYKIHHDAVVKAENLANRHLNQISNNIFLLQGAIETYGKGAFSENVLTPLEDPELQLDFYNLELINKYLDYQALVEKVNHDMASWNRSNDRLFTVALSGRIPMADIAKNRDELAKRTKEILHHLEDLMQETYTFGAYVRAFLKVDKRYFFTRMKPIENISISEEKIAAEREKLVKESEETMENDREGRLKKYNVK